MEYMIKRALDSGAHGVMTPMCHTAVSPSFSNHRLSPLPGFPLFARFHSLLSPSSTPSLLVLSLARDPSSPRIETLLLRRKLTHRAAQDDARRIVSYSKYPPRGTRGYGPMFSPFTFNISESTYAATADANLLVIVQIESKVGVENVEEIAGVDGIDVLFIGLSAPSSCPIRNMPPSHPRTESPHTTSLSSRQRVPGVLS
jgi:hypothetical protein